MSHQTARFLTPKQLANHLQVSLSWIHKRTMTEEKREKHGIADEIPHLHVGGVIRFDLRQVEAWLRKQAPQRKRNGAGR